MKVKCDVGQFTAKETYLSTLIINLTRIKSKYSTIIYNLDDVKDAMKGKGTG